MSREERVGQEGDVSVWPPAKKRTSCFVQETAYRFPLAYEAMGDVFIATVFGRQIRRLSLAHSRLRLPIILCIELMT